MTQSAAIWLPFDTSKVGPFAAGAHELLQVYITSPIAKLGSGTSMLTLNDGGTATLVGWGGNFMLFDYVVQPGQNTSNLLITGYSDNGAVFAGLSGTGFNDPIAMSTIFGVAPASPPLSVDTLAPTVASISRVGGATAGVGSVVQYSVTFSESVTGVDASAFSLKTTGVTGASIASVTGSGSSWVVSVNAGSGSGAIELDVTGGKIKDLAGNGLAAGVFQSPVNFPDSQFPSSIAVGDLNGDGKPDIVTGDGSSNTVSVLLGNGDGTFGVSQVFAAGSNTSSVSLADVNGDGKLDIVATNYGSSNISVLLGNGNGTFQTQKVYTTSNGPGLNPTFEAVVDVNHDGNFDVVTSDWGTNSVSVLLGNGDGTFKAPNVYAAGSGTFSIAVGDFNLDGNIDIVTANYNANSVSILLGNGNGTFQAQQTYAVGANPWSVAVADLNGDGKLDVATVNNTSKTVSILFGNGNGTFQPQQTFPVGYSPVSLALADLNGDGKLDIVTADNAGDVSVLFGFGDGTFQLKQSLLVGSGLYALAVADLNGDGRLDIATSSGPTNTVSVMLGGSPTTAGPSVAIANLLTIGGAVAAQTTTDKLTINPFSTVTIADANGTSPVETLTVTLDSAAKGVLSGTGGGSYNAATGVYTVTGSAAAVTTAIRGLVFTPAANRVVPGATETTTFTISVNDSLAPAVANSTTTVVTTSVNDAPTISGTKVGQLLTDVQTLRPLSSVTIADIDPGQTETVTVTLDSAGKGAVSNLSGGVYNAATGVYSISGMASVVTAAIDSLVFTPTAGRLAAGAKDTTTFTISVSDGVAPAVVNATTTALVTGAGSMAGGPGNDALSSPWAFQLGAAGGSVYRLYGATLGREPDLAGFQGWVAALTGGQSLAQITSGFINSAEFLSTYGTLNNTQFVTLLYNNVLHRSPDPAGLVGWAGMLNAGQSKESVVDGFSESAEYQGNTSAAASAYASNVVYAATFGQVYRLYGATLNRQPDGPGLQSWVNNLVAGQTLAGITSGFVNSAEFQKTYGALDNTQFVFLLYNNVLHRGPDVAGLQGWVGMLNNGQSRESVVDGFSESAEYQGNTAAAFKSFMQTSVPGWSDFIFGGAGSNTLLGGPGDDTFRFDLNAAGSDQVWGFQAWDTLNMVNFGYSSAADATGHMTQSGADVTFADRGENITFHNTTLATLSGASFTFA